MTHSRSLASAQPGGGAASKNQFHRRLGACLVLTVFNATVIWKSAGTLYRATARNVLQQAGVTLLFVVLLGSLARVWLLALRSRTR
jgi:hypothetical protein